MPSDLHEVCRLARERIPVPAFPLESIRHAAQGRGVTRVGPKRSLIAGILAAVSIIAVAAAAEIAATQSHIRFTPSGGMVLSSAGKMSSRTITSDSQVREAAAHLDFSAVLPAGLPPGSKPIRLATAGNDVIAVTYDLPGVWRASHHLLWIFLANSATMKTGAATSSRYQLRPDGRMSKALWRVGPEQVIVVSNGLTASELQAIKDAMQREAR